METEEAKHRWEKMWQSVVTQDRHLLERRLAAEDVQHTASGRDLPPTDWASQLEEALSRHLEALLKPRAALAPAVLAQPLEWLSSQLVDTSLTEPHFGNGSRVCVARPRVSSEISLQINRELIDNWAEHVTSILARLDDDAGQLGRRLGERATCERLAQLEIGLSDPHRRSQTVACLKFSGGTSVIYKPRPLAMDEAFADFLTWLSYVLGDPRPPRVPWTLSRAGYGWVERLGHTPCCNTAEVAHYFGRLGGLTAVVWALRGVDLHAENLVAVGSHPVILDLEGLFHNELEPGPRNFSALDCALFPFWWSTSEGVVQFAGLLEEANAQGTTPRHLPELDGRAQSLRDHRDRFVREFHRSAAAISANRDALSSASGVLSSFAEATGRFLFRPTRSYQLVMKSANSRWALQDAPSQDIALDRLWLGVRGDERFDALVPFEKGALRQRDVPLFGAVLSERHLHVGMGDRLLNFFPRSALEVVRSHLDQLDADRARLEASTISRAIDLSDHGFQLEHIPPRSNDPDADDALRHAAAGIAELLAGELSPTDRVSWVGVVQEGSHRWRLAPMPGRLYDGAAGVVLFLALAAETLEWPDLLASALAMRFAEAETSSTHELGGAYVGEASYAYVDLILAQRTGDERLRSRALSTLVLLARPDSGRDGHIDLSAGLAGDILLLLAGFRYFKREELLRAALQRGRLLLRYQTAEGGWLAPGSPVVHTGHAHGAAGISFALSELWSATRDDSIRSQWTAGLEFLERSRRVGTTPPDWLPSTATGRPYTNVRGISGVCHGPAGVALAYGRAVELGISDCEEGLEQAAIALHSEAQAPDDSLCHGLAGRADLALRLARSVDSIASQKDAWTLRLARRARALSSADHGFSTGSPAGLNTADLFLGIAGLGYAFLRALDQTGVPCVAALESPSEAGL